ncbi:MAG: transcriptional regulator [Anaerolineae bacterium]|jgi:transcriptional regulator with XRE-family HTH domain|nr:transcriptional regulator [Anaerolineae bacterium]
MNDMNLKDFGSRFKKAKAGDNAPVSDAPKVFDPAESIRLRAKMLGVLMRDARLNAQRSAEDVARYLRIDAETVELWELGEAVPGLPHLELLAYFLDVPVSHFWGVRTLESARSGRQSAQTEFMILRNRMIGALMRQAREERGLSLSQVAERAGLDPAALNQYELGEWGMPMHELSVVASVLERNLSYFLETASQIGDLLATRESWKHFNELPDDLRAFAANPQNIGFIEIALAFSRMPSDKLKSIAVSMLDITGY